MLGPGLRLHVHTYISRCERRLADCCRGLLLLLLLVGLAIMVVLGMVGCWSSLTASRIDYWSDRT